MHAEHDEYGAQDEPAPLELPESPEGGWHPIDQDDWLDEWAAWLAFLREAVQHGGFRRSLTFRPLLGHSLLGRRPGPPTENPA